MEIRQPKQNDQEQGDKAYYLINDLISQHNIEMAIWIGAMWSIIADRYISSGIKYAEFTKQLVAFSKHCKPWFKEYEKEL